MVKGKKTGLLTILILIIALVSCDTGSILYTLNELSDMYKVGLETGGVPTERQAILNPKELLVVKLDIDTNAPPPETVLVRLQDYQKNIVASVSFSSSATSSRTLDQNSIIVTSFNETLPPIRLPENLKNGYYQLHIHLLDEAGKNLVTSTRNLLVYSEAIPEIRVSLHPATPGPSQKVLLKATFSGNLSNLAWIRWRIDGKISQEGTVGDYNDRIVWQASDSQNIHTIQAEFFPFEPPADALPLALRLIKVPVSSTVQPTTSILANDSVFSRINLAEHRSHTLPLSATTVRPAVTGFGQIYPESTSRNYGYAFADNSGMEIRQQLFPERDKSPDFALLLLLEPLPGFNGFPQQGHIYSLANETGRLLLSLGVRNSQLFLDTETTQTSKKLLPDEALIITMNAVSNGDRLHLHVYVNEELYVTGEIADSRLNTNLPSLTIAGIDGIRAVYEEMLTSNSLVNPYEIVSKRRFGSRVIQATDFEYLELLHSVRVDDQTAPANNATGSSTSQPIDLGHTNTIAATFEKTETLQNMSESRDATQPARTAALPALFVMDWPADQIIVSMVADYQSGAPDFSLILDEDRSIILKPSGTVIFGEQRHEGKATPADSGSLTLTVVRNVTGLSLTWQGEPTLQLSLPNPIIRNLHIAVPAHDIVQPALRNLPQRVIFLTP